MSIKRPNLKDRSCVYCGDVATCLDHVIPHSAVRPTHRKRFRKSEVVPSCQECNALLGSRLLLTIADRAEYLASRLKVRHRKDLQFPAWSPSELSELGEGLKSSAMAGMERRSLIEGRIDNCENVATQYALTIAKTWD